MDFLIIQVVVVENGELFHSCLHLGAETRILLHQGVVCLTALRSLVDILHDRTELFDTTLDLVTDAGKHLKFQLEPGHGWYSAKNCSKYIYINLL